MRGRLPFTCANNVTRTWTSREGSEQANGERASRCGHYRCALTAMSKPKDNWTTVARRVTWMPRNLRHVVIRGQQYARRRTEAPRPRAVQWERWKGPQCRCAELLKRSVRTYCVRPFVRSGRGFDPRTALPGDAAKNQAYEKR